MKKNVVLIGMPGVGKSTAGVILAKKLGMGFVDTDLVIQEQENRLLCEIIAEAGVDGFLETENRVCSLLEAENCVIATGGSVVYGTEAMEHLRSIGTVLWLRLPYSTLRRRLKNLEGRGVVLREGQTLKDLFEERGALYEHYADIVVDETGLSIEKTVALAEELLLKNS